MIDLDHFKSINDRFGHAVGDRVLQIFATTAESLTRPLDLVGRLGGEEFAAVLYNVSREKAMIIADAILLIVGEGPATNTPVEAK